MDGSSQDTLHAVFQRLKEKPTAHADWLPVFQYGRRLAWLEPVNFWDLARPEKILLLTGWRKADNPEATRGWLADQVLHPPDRLLFWIKGLNGTPVGTIGLAHVDPDTAQGEITDLVRGVPGALPGVMYAATQALLAWGFLTLDLETLFLEVGAENAAALRLVELSHFEEVCQTRGGNGICLSIMRSNWMAGHRGNKAA